MKKILLILAALIAAGLAAVYFGPEHQRFLKFAEQRDAWHRRCDVYIDKPVTSPAAQACQQELAEMMAYAIRQGWN